MFNSFVKVTLYDEAKETINKLQELLHAKKLSGLVIIPSVDGGEAFHAIEGNHDLLVAHLAYMAYEYLLLLEICEKAVQIASYRITHGQSPQQDFRKN